MVNLISSSSDIVSSLQAPGGDGLKAEDRAKRWLELQSQNEWLKVENDRLGARNLVIEERCRDQMRSLEDKEELIIRLKEEAVSMSGTGGRWKEKYERVQEEFENGERKWRAELGKAEEKSRHLEVEMKKLEIDLQAASRAAEGGGENGEKMKAEVEHLKRLVDDKDGVIGLLKQKYEVLEKEKIKLETELGERVVKLEGSVAKWAGMEVNSVVGEKTVGNTKSLIEPKKEIVEEAINVGSDKKLNSKVVPAQKLTNPPIVELSDDEEEDYSSGATTPKAIANAPSVASTLAVPQKRKAEDVAYSAERKSESKRSKFDVSNEGKSWETSEKMFLAFTTDVELCMNSVCALYRKHKSLGVWKNHSDGNSFLKQGLEKSVVDLGKFLTDGDPEGRMKKSLADLDRYPRGVEFCRTISRHQVKELFEIYSSNRDPLFSGPMKRFN